MSAVGPYREPWRPKGPPCPRCQPGAATLRRERVGENHVHRCEACGGVWVTARDFNEILVDIDRQNQILSDSKLEGPGRNVGEPISCPVCGELATRANFGRRSGVLVDSCGKHGIWFDAGELRRVVEYLRDRAKLYELDSSPAELVDSEEDELDARIAALLARSRAREAVPLWKAVLEALIDALMGR